MRQNLERGFALGMVLMMIVLLAALVTFFSITGSSQSGYVEKETIRAGAFAIRSQGGTIRDTFRSMLRQGFTPTSLDYAPDCTGKASCIMNRSVSGISLQNMDQRIFSDTTSVGQVSSYDLWRFDSTGNIGPTLTSTIVALSRPLKPEVCYALQSSITGAQITAAAQLPVISAFKGFEDGSANVELQVQPTTAEGCGYFENEDKFIYYMILGGNKSS